MKIKAPKNCLLRALSRIQGIVEKTSIKPITANVLIAASGSELSFAATNLQIGMIAKYSDVDVIKEGKVSLNARKLFEIIKELPDTDITLSEHENYRMKISCGKDVNFNIIGLPPEDFPSFANDEEELFVDWKISKLIKMIDLTSFSISKDETKLNINGAYLEAGEKDITRMVTTDGYRLSIMDDALGKAFPLSKGLIVPQKGIIELNKILQEKRAEEKTVSIVANKNSFIAKAGEIILYIRLIEKSFPEYKVIIPNSESKTSELFLEKEMLRPTLKRMLIISTENNRPVVFSFKNNSLNIFTEDSELGSVSETLELKEKINKEFSLCINCSYLLDILNAAEDDIIVEYSTSEKDKPIIVKPANKKNITYIIMPMIMS